MKGSNESAAWSSRAAECAVSLQLSAVLNSIACASRPLMRRRWPILPAHRCARGAVRSDGQVAILLIQERVEAFVVGRREAETPSSAR